MLLDKINLLIGPLLLGIVFSSFGAFYTYKLIKAKVLVASPLFVKEYNLKNCNFSEVGVWIAMLNTLVFGPVSLTIGIICFYRFFSLLVGFIK